MVEVFIDIKKHYATSKCPVYDVMIYRDLKTYPYTGRLYSKIRFEEVQFLLAQGKFKPTPLSEALFEKKFQAKRN